MNVVIFGLGRLSSVAWHALVHDSPHEVVGFTVDLAYRHADAHHGLPVVAFERVEERFPPGETAMLVPLGGMDMNRLRMAKYLQASEKGYDFVTYVSSRAMTWPDLEIGENSMAYEGAIVQPFATIGRNAILRSGCHVSHHARVGLTTRASATIASSRPRPASQAA